MGDETDMAYQMQTVVDEKQSEDSKRAHLRDSIRFKVIRFIILWIVAELIVGGLGPIVFTNYFHWIVGVPTHAEGFAAVSVSTAGALLAVSASLAAART